MKLKRRIFWFVVALELLLTVAAAFAQQPITNKQPQKKIAEISVTHTNFHGWDATVLRNRVAEIILVPSIGRIMYFGFFNDGSADVTAQNVLWNNPAVGTDQKPDVEGWINFGGDKVWPAPQSDWPKITGRPWPPPKTFDSTPYTESVEGDQVQLLSSVDSSYGIRMRRTITIDPQKPVMTVKTTFEKTQGAPVSVAVWMIAQMASPERAFILLPKKSAFAHGYTNMMPAQPDDIKTNGRLLSLVRDPKDKTMIGSDGEILLWVGEQTDVLIENKTAPLPGSNVRWPDGLHSKIYTNSGDELKYVEFELLTPLANLKPGTSSSMSVTYTLMPRTEKDPLREAKKIFSPALN
ncbi:MAG TPA: hypothetical protein VGF44_09065 [Terriglobales bacterium]